MKSYSKTEKLKLIFTRDRNIRLNNTKRKAKISKIILIVFLSVYLLISIYPFLWAFIVSFENPNRIPTIGLNPFIKNAGWTAANYQYFFESSLGQQYAGKWILNSVIYATANSTINCFFNFLAGYALARIKFRGKNLVVWYILVALMVPVQATQIPQLLILMKLGLISSKTPDSLWFIGILATGMTSGVLIFMVRQFYINQSASIEEAGLIDGLTTFKVFYKISLKSMIPLLATQWAMVFIGSWNNFIMFTLWASGLPDRMTFQPALVTISQSSTGDMKGQGMLLAATNLSVIPVMGVYIASLHFQKKVTVNGEK